MIAYVIALIAIKKFKTSNLYVFQETFDMISKNSLLKLVVADVSGITNN